MDIATLIGLVGAFAIVLLAMFSSGSIMLFVNVPSLLIVVAGSFMVVMMKFGIHQFLGAIKVAINAFIFKPTLPTDLIAKSVELANLARKDGMLALESAEIDNDFFRMGIQYLVDGIDIAVIKSTLSKEMNLTVERHEAGQKIFKALADVGPAMGMIGTLIGLVQMLSTMDDPKTIGPSMAIALLTTLYGAMMANMIATPIADKLALRSDEERMTKSVIIDAVVAIHSGQNPRVIEELLKTYLPVSKRKSTAADDAQLEVG